jgi:hypothetical protein
MLLFLGNVSSAPAGAGEIMNRASQSGGGASLRHRLPSQHASGARFFARASVGEKLKDDGGDALDSMRSTFEILS